MEKHLGITHYFVPWTNYRAFLSMHIHINSISLVKFQKHFLFQKIKNMEFTDESLKTEAH